MAGNQLPNKMFRDKDGDIAIGKVVVSAIGAFILLLVVLSLWPLRSIDAGQRGVLTVFGKVNPNVLGEGLHFVNPLASVHAVSLQTQTINFDNDNAMSAASNDLQDVTIAVVANYHLPESDVVPVYQQYQGLPNFQSNKLEPAVREAVKSITAQYTAEELVTKRSEVSTKIEAAIVTDFQQLGVVEESFKIVNLTFSDDFTKAIEAKVTAVQDAEAAKNKLSQVQYEAQQRVAEADGEAKAIAIQAAAIQNQGGAAYIQLKAIEKWDGKLPVYQLAGTTPFINITK